MKRHLKFSAALFALLLAVFAVACQKQGVEAANDKSNAVPMATPSLPIWDRDFLVQTAKTEIRERSLSQVAWNRALSADVKEYARTVMDDHAQTLQQLQDLMNRKGLSQTPSVPEASVEGTHELDAVSGSEFDHQYIALMTAEMQQAIGRLRQAAETTEDREVRAYASAVLPMFEREQQQAFDLEKKLAAHPNQ